MSAGVKKLKNLDEFKLVYGSQPDLITTESERALFESLISRELDPNGGATVLSVNQKDLVDKLHLPGSEHKELMNKFSLYFLAQVYSETAIESGVDSESSSFKENEQMWQANAAAAAAPTSLLLNQRSQGAAHVLGVVRDSARELPDLLNYFADKYPQMIVKTSLLLNSKEINTLCMSDYRRNVNASYLNGTYRYGPLLETSLVGIRNEEIGDYFPEFIHGHLEKNEFLCHCMPWGDLSINENMSPMNSDDGPIVWARPGEQLIPTTSHKEQQLLNSNSSNCSHLHNLNNKKKLVVFNFIYFSNFLGICLLSNLRIK